MLFSIERWENMKYIFEFFSLFFRFFAIGLVTAILFWFFVVNAMFTVIVIISKVLGS